MPKEIGPREKALREMREAKYADRGGKTPTVAELRKVAAKVAARAKAKPRKGKKR